MKKILVTGSAGYVGRHLCNLLTSLDYQVHGLDIKPPVETEIPWNQIDIRNNINFLERYDALVHLAALMQVGESVKIPYEYYNTNFNGTYNVLTGITCNNFIFASTGSAEVPVSPYSLSKLACEHIVEEYCTKNNIAYTMFRFYNVIGTDGKIYPTNPDGLMYNMILAEKSGTLKIFGDDYNTPDGSPVRDYVHVMDICRAIQLAIETPANGLENLGTGTGHTVKEIANAYMQANNCKFELSICGRRNGDAERTVLKNPSSYMKNNYTLEQLVKR